MGKKGGVQPPSTNFKRRDQKEKARLGGNPEDQMGPVKGGEGNSCQRGKKNDRTGRLANVITRGLGRVGLKTRVAG